MELLFGAQTSCRHSGFRLEAETWVLEQRISHQLSSEPSRVAPGPRKPRCCACVRKYCLRLALLSSVLQGRFYYILGLQYIGCRFIFLSQSNGFSLLGFSVDTGKHKQAFSRPGFPCSLAFLAKGPACLWVAEVLGLCSDLPLITCSLACKAVVGPRCSTFMQWRLWEGLVTSFSSHEADLPSELLQIHLWCPKLIGSVIQEAAA